MVTDQESGKVDYVRQRERTVDNLKRLLAVVFSLAYTTAGKNAFDKLKPYLEGASPLNVTVGRWILNLEMLTLFSITAAVFYHQGTKALDVRYALPRDVRANPYGFGWDFLTIVVQMVPFILMANALAPDLTGKTGFTWFFFGYVLLLVGGLGLGMLLKVRHWDWVRRLLHAEALAPGELARDRLLRDYWVVMNSAIVCLIAILFGGALITGVSCPTNPETGTLPWFLFAFGVVALLRDWLDYRWAWPFLFPNEPHVTQQLQKWPVTRMAADSAVAKCWRYAGVAVYVLAMVLGWLDHWFDPGYWVSACSRAH